MTELSKRQLHGRLGGVNIEPLFAALAAHTPIALHIDRNLSFRAGTEAQFIHFLGNWGRRQKIRTVSFTPSAPVGDPSAWFVTTILTATKIASSEPGGPSGQLLKQQINTLIRGLLAPVTDLRLGRFVICRDFSSLSYPPTLYTTRGADAEPQVKDIGLIQEQIRDWTTGEDSIAPIFSSQETELEETILPVVLYELFRNTHDHARFLENGATVGWSVRGTLMKLHEGQLSALVDYADSSYRGYLQGIGRALKAGDDPNLHLLELSVFDSGPGLAATRSGRSPTTMSLSEERRYFESCFEKHSTGVPGDFSRGLGLERVQRALTKLKGYMRVRTGRLDLCRDFNRFPFKARVSFFDGPSMQPTSEHPLVDGALFTVMVPVRRVA